MNKLLLALALCLSMLELSAQVVINEICASNLNGLTDGDGDREDWFELYNSGATAVNLSGWFLSDNPANPQKWVIPNGQTIAAGAYRTVFCSAKDKVQGTSLHTNFKLTQTKSESVVLTMANGTAVDSYMFGIPNQVNHSYGRNPNGGSTWKIYTTPTPGATNNSNSFLSYAPAVVASQAAGFYPGSIMVGLSTDPGFTIRYTTNGSEPTITSTLYAAPLNIAATTVLKACAFSGNPQVLPGFVMYHTYFINVNHTVPVVSIAGNNVNALMSGTQTPRFGSLEYFENNMLESDGYGELNKHGNDSWAYPQRGVDWITRDQMGYDDELDHQFFKERTRKKFQRLILKAAANDNYPTASGAHIRDSYVHTLALNGGMNVDVRTHLSCVLYVNGQYWGVYDLREKVDDSDFTKYYYDQDEFDIDYIKTWGSTWSEYGTSTDWYTLKNFILGNNMAIPANYANAGQQLDFLSLIDYVIINSHSVCKDWLNWNTSWWRGRNPDGGARKWRYTLWDMDATFGHYTNYTGIPNTGPTADPCDVEQIPNSGDPQNHIDIFMALYANQQFKDLYINRYADLLNTSLSCEYMNELLDSMINVIAPEMAQQCTRWGGNVNQWNQNVNTLHNFINTRCQILEPAIVDCYDVTGPFELTVKISPDTSPNQVKVNTITPTIYPYIGAYFGGVNIDLAAKPATGWLFDHWEVAGNTFGPNQFAAAIALAFQTSGMATAFFVEVAPCSPPTNVAISTTLGYTLMDWTDQSLAMNYPFRYRIVGDTVWTEFTSLSSDWDFDVLPGCSQYEGQIQTACPQGTSPFVDFTFSTPDYLQGFDLADTDFCNAAGTMLNATFPGASYQWNDGSNGPMLNVTAPGNYWVTVALDGCTRTDTALVSQVYETAAIEPIICPDESFVLGGETFDAQNPSGQVLLPNMAANGCDSVVQVSLQFLMPSQNQVFQTNCDPASVGVDSVYLTNAVGCDSLVITTTTLTPISVTNLAATSCNPASVGVDTIFLVNALGCDSLVITTTAFTNIGISTTPIFVQNCDPAAVGVDTILLTNVAGCDSLVIITTTLATFSQTLLGAISCNPNSVGIDTVFLTSALGCDSLVITTTTFTNIGISTTPIFLQNCDPAAVGVDTILLTNVAGCDSLVITTTTFASFSQTLLTAVSCNPASVGVDTILLVNALGCDSLVITTTAFTNIGISTTPLFVQSCDPAAVGVDTLLLTNAAGCDSLVITTTTFATFSQTLLTAVSCNPAAVGVDTILLVNALGCDSLVITTTMFDPVGISITPLFLQNCDPAAVGVDTLLLTNVAGCDSLVITTTTLAPFSETFLTAFSCDLGSVGTDTILLTNQFGCDSLVITTVTYAGLDFEASAQGELCFGEKNGLIQLETVLTDFLPVELVLENQSAQFYTGNPVQWEDLPPGVYVLLATNTAGCTMSQVVGIAEATELHLDLGLQPIVLHTGDSIWVEPIADFQIAIAEWSPSSGVHCASCPGTFISAPRTETYTLTASDANGCSTNASLMVRVEQGVRIFVPNVIRPGSGGPNEYLTIFAGPEVAQIHSLQLFDRWGNHVFEQYNLMPNVPVSWDGTFRGELVPQGVIVWMLTAKTKDGRVVNLSGDITVLR
ncbi:MAG: CotH kinase family protein [Saprospiraceae bacterium]|nr:CotH kinase family protein [Saprospiraceae bacterium]MCF8252849.1 CotH kinase family protein [Saprospiraceae bacterium]MCF8313289.1 CotH kinase family protein [Saprospiraceae bacterium]